MILSNTFRARMQEQPLLLLMVLLLMVFFCNLVSALVIQGITNVLLLDYQAILQNISTENTLSKRNLLRSITIFNQLMTFLVPSALVMWMAYPTRWKNELCLNRSSNAVIILLGVLFLFATFPLAQGVFSINKSLPLPTSVVELEEKINLLSKALLVMESPWELVFNIITIAVIPAIGEELLFRGVLQQQFARWLKKPVLALWLAAFIFSAIHGQFLGFLPRLLLGAALGYLLLWTQNLWIPIIAHFFNNAIQILVAYFRTDLLESVKLAQEPTIPLFLMVVSSIFVLYLGFMIKKLSRHKLGG